MRLESKEDYFGPMLMRGLIRKVRVSDGKIVFRFENSQVESPEFTDGRKHHGEILEWFYANADRLVTEADIKTVDRGYGLED